MISKIPLLAVLMSALVWGPAVESCAADLGTAAAHNLTITGNHGQRGRTAKRASGRK
jgi:hypothetical protein